MQEGIGDQLAASNLVLRLSAERDRAEYEAQICGRRSTAGKEASECGRLSSRGAETERRRDRGLGQRRCGLGCQCRGSCILCQLHASEGLLKPSRGRHVRGLPQNLAPLLHIRHVAHHAAATCDAAAAATLPGHTYSFVNTLWSQTGQADMGSSSHAHYQKQQEGEAQGRGRRRN